jgi:hypothetical protein
MKLLQNCQDQALTIRFHKGDRTGEEAERMLKKSVQQGRSERKAEAYAVGTLRP